MGSSAPTEVGCFHLVAPLYPCVSLSSDAEARQAGPAADNWLTPRPRSLSQLIAHWGTIKYDNRVRPGRANTSAAEEDIQPDTVKLGYHLQRVWDVDERAETFEIQGFLRLSWKDDRLAYKVSSTASAQNRWTSCAPATNDTITAYGHHCNV